MKRNALKAKKGKTRTNTSHKVRIFRFESYMEKRGVHRWGERKNNRFVHDHETNQEKKKKREKWKLSNNNGG